MPGSTPDADQRQVGGDGLARASSADQFGTSLDVVASVDRDGPELLATQRWQREAAAHAWQYATVQGEIAASCEEAPQRCERPQPSYAHRRPSFEPNATRSQKL